MGMSANGVNGFDFNGRESRGLPWVREEFPGGFVQRAVLDIQNMISEKTVCAALYHAVKQPDVVKSVQMSEVAKAYLHQGYDVEFVLMAIRNISLVDSQASTIRELCGMVDANADLSREKKEALKTRFRKEACPFDVVEQVPLPSPVVPSQPSQLSRRSPCPCASCKYVRYARQTRGGASLYLFSSHSLGSGPDQYYQLP